MRHFDLGVFIFLSVIIICATYLHATGKSFEHMWTAVLVIIVYFVSGME